MPGVLRHYNRREHQRRMHPRHLDGREDDPPTLLEQLESLGT